MSKPLAITAAVASQRSIRHMLTLTTSPEENDLEQSLVKQAIFKEAGSFQIKSTTFSH